IAREYFGPRACRGAAVEVASAAAGAAGTATGGAAAGAAGAATDSSTNSSTATVAAARCAAAAAVAAAGRGRTELGAILAALLLRLGEVDATDQRYGARERGDSLHGNDPDQV